MMERKKIGIGESGDGIMAVQGHRNRFAILFLLGYCRLLSCGVGAF